MNSYEYKVERVEDKTSSYIGSLGESKFFGHEGDNGWELVWVCVYHYPFNIFYYFKRLKHLSSQELIEARKEIERLKGLIEDYKYLCEFDNIPKFFIDNPRRLRSIKITPFSEMQGEEKEWAEEAIRKYESGENKVVETHEQEIAVYQKIIDTKEAEIERLKLQLEAMQNPF